MNIRNRLLPLSIAASLSLASPPLYAAPDTAAATSDVTGCTQFRRGDFDWDCQPDLLWQNSTSGRTVVWTQFNLTRITGRFTNPMGYADPQWKVRAIHDFNADGSSDIVYQHAGSHDIVVALFRRFDRLNSVSTVPSWSAYAVRASGDYNADGQPDLILQDRENGKAWVWLMDGLQRTAELPLIPQTHDAGSVLWEVIAGADFDLDGQDDVAWRNPVDGSIDVWLMDGRQLRSNHGVIEAPGAQWHFGAVEKFATDGAQTILLEDHLGRIRAWALTPTPDVLYTLPFNPSRVLDENWRMAGSR